MKKIITLFSAALLALPSAGFAQTFQEDFSSTSGTALPVGWTLKTLGTTTGWITNTGAYAIIPNNFEVPAGNGRYAIIDDYKTAGDNNDSTGLISPVIDLTGKTSQWLTFKAYFAGAEYRDKTKKESAWVAASTNGGTTWTVLKAIAVNYTWELNAVDLSAYSNMNNVKIGFFFSDDKQGRMIGCAVDDIKIYQPPTNEVALTTITPYKDKPKQGYGVASATNPIGGTVYNSGGTAITTFKVHYQLGSNPVVTDVITGVNIAPFTAGTFTCPTALSMPATLGQYELKMSVELAGDADATNDSLNSNATSVAFKPAKKILVEEGTGTWCGWCPRGAVYMDSLAHTFPSDVTLVAVHNNDPMKVSAYDSYMGGKIGGYPSVLVDRGEEMDPSLLINAHSEMKDNFGFATITMADQGAASFDLSVKVSVKPAMDLTGDYRLALILTENDVHGEDGQWAQRNYYSGGLSGQLTGAGHAWHNQTDPVAAEDMRYEFVARAIVPNPTGAAGSLPATMTAGSTYDYTFTTTVPQPYHRSDMKVTVILIRSSDGAVLNSSDMIMPIGISNIAAGVEKLSVYPNPATDVTNIKFSLNETATVSVQVLNPLGQVVNTIAAQQFEKGAQKISVNTANLAAGIYTIKLSTEKGSLTQQLSIVK